MTKVTILFVLEAEGEALHECIPLVTYMATAAIRPVVAHSRALRTSCFSRHISSRRYGQSSIRLHSYSSMVQSAAAQQKGSSSQTATLACGCFWSPVCKHCRCCWQHRVFLNALAHLHAYMRQFGLQPSACTPHRICVKVN